MHITESEKLQGTSRLRFCFSFAISITHFTLHTIHSFGEDTKLLHSFEENFNEQSGASIIKQFTFDQKKTKIAHLLKMCTVLFDGAKNRKHANSSAQVSQLLLIVSDGRGIFLEGKEVQYFLLSDLSLGAHYPGLATIC